MADITIKKLDPPAPAAAQPIRLTLEEDLLDLELLARQIRARQREAANPGRRQRTLKRKTRINLEKLTGQQKGMTWKLWNHYSWLLDITEIMGRMSPGYLAHLAGVDPWYEEALRRRWASWCRQPENFIAQPLRINWWDWWSNWVKAGELDRFKNDIYQRRRASKYVQMQGVDVICNDPYCPQQKQLSFTIRYGVIFDENGYVAGIVPTVDDRDDPLETAGRLYSNDPNKAQVRRQCPWCGTYDYYEVTLKDANWQQRETDIETEEKEL